MEYYKNLDLANITYFCEVDLVEKTEQWRDIPNYENMYQISDLGRLKSYDRIVKHPNGKSNFPIKGKIKKNSFAPNGYLRFSICKNNKRHYDSIHRAVAIAFIPNPLNLPEVNHIGLYPDGRQGNKHDNRAISLEWSTKSENTKHAFREGLSNTRKGEKSNFAKLTEVQVLEIRAINPKDIDAKKSLELKYNISRTIINQIIKRTRWKHVI